MRSRLLLAVLLAGTTALPVLASTLDEAMKPAEHEALGGKIAKYFEAKDANKAIDKAKEELSKEFESIKKKKNRDPLSMCDDLGKSLWQAFGYKNAKGVSKGKVKTVPFKAGFYGEKAQLSYAIWVPTKYEPTKPYPVILCIPEKGEKPEAHVTDKWIDKDVRENVLIVCVPMPEDVAQWGEQGSAEQQGGFANVIMTMKEIRNTYAVDYDRVFLAGRGDGVGAAMSIAGRALDRFAGVIGRSGDMDGKPLSAENFKNLPTFFAGAGANATAFSERNTKEGYNNCTIKAEGTEADVWTWMQAHPRVSYPAEVVLYPGKPFPNKACWIAVPASNSKEAEFIKAKADKATNTITIDASDGITKVTLLLNDELVDLEKEVKVICNGAEHVDKLPRNLWATMNWMYDATSEPGRIFTASRDYDVPAKPKPKEEKK